MRQSDQRQVSCARAPRVSRAWQSGSYAAYGAGFSNVETATARTDQRRPLERPVVNLMVRHLRCSSQIAAHDRRLAVR